MPSADETPADVPKYSRYRRRTAETEAPPPPPPVVEIDVKQPKDEGITRSMSRYRRSRVVPKFTDPNDTPTIPEVPQIPRQAHSQSVSAGSRPTDLRQPVRSGTDPLTRMGEETIQEQSRETEAERSRRKAKIEVEEEDRRVAEHEAQRAHTRKGAELEGGQKRSGETDAERRRKARKILEEEERREAELDAAKDAQKLRGTAEETERILAEQKKKDLERLKAELDAAPPIQKISSPREKTRFFSRKKKLDDPTSPRRTGDDEAGCTTFSRTQTRNDDPRTNGAARPVEAVRSTQQKHEQSRKVEAPKIANGIVQGGGGIVPQTDAPISASNAGERVRLSMNCILDNC